jgi:hypothetical protein
MTRVLTVLNHGSESYTGKQQGIFAKSLQPEIITQLEQIFRWANEPNPLGQSTSTIRQATPVRQLDHLSNFLVTQGQGTTGNAGGYNPDRASVTGDDERPGYFGERESELHRKALASAAKQSAKNVTGGLTPFGSAIMTRAKLGATEDMGVYANVNRLHEHLVKCSENTFQPPITKINMVGWSRGAVTCLRQANFLQNHWPGIEVNIFGIDPVAGLGQDTDDGDYASNSIPNNVNKYIFVVAASEDRFAFPPLPLPEQYWKYICLPFPGDHSNVAKTDNSSGKVTAHLCYKFLKQMGSLESNGPSLRDRMKRELCLSEKDILSEYDKLLGSIRVNKSPNPGKVVLGHGAATFAMGLATSWETGRGGQPFTDKFFINQHHKKVFESLHERTYKELCAHNGEHSRLAGNYSPAGLDQLPEHAKRIKVMLCYKSPQERRALMDDTSERRDQDIADLKRIQMSIDEKGLEDYQGPRRRASSTS